MARVRRGKPRSRDVDAGRRGVLLRRPPVGPQALVLLRRQARRRAVAPVPRGAAHRRRSPAARSPCSSRSCSRARSARPVVASPRRARSLARGERPAPRARSRARTSSRSSRAVQRHGRAARARARGRAGVPALGEPRAEDAAHLDPRLRRGLEEGAIPRRRPPQTIRREARRLERLVQDLLDLARMNRTRSASTGRRSTSPRPPRDAGRRYESRPTRSGSARGRRARPGARDARRRPRAPGALEPRRERAALHAARRDRPRHRDAGRAGGRRHRPGTRRRRPAARVRALLPVRPPRRATGRSAPGSGSRSSRSSPRRWAALSTSRAGPAGSPRSPSLHGSGAEPAPLRSLRAWHGSEPVTLDDVERARGDDRRARPPHAAVLVRHALGSSARVRLKAELFQKTGSFKARGALNRLAALTADERRRGVITFSAGNHAQAVAWACARGRRRLRSLVMWQGANPPKVEATRGYGATVDLEAPDPTDAFDAPTSSSRRPVARSSTRSTTRA